MVTKVSLFVGQTLELCIISESRKRIKQGISLKYLIKTNNTIKTNKSTFLVSFLTTREV